MNLQLKRGNVKNVKKFSFCGGSIIKATSLIHYLLQNNIYLNKLGLLFSQDNINFIKRITLHLYNTIARMKSFMYFVLAYCSIKILIIYVNLTLYIVSLAHFYIMLSHIDEKYLILLRVL